MNIEFEQKYFVIKVDDVTRYLNPEGKRALYRCLDSLSDSRRQDGKKDNAYLVLNTDEAYAPQVAKIMQEHGHFTPGGQIAVTAREPEPLTIDQLKQMDGEPVWTGRRWGVVRSCPPKRPDMPAIHFNYGWEWASDVLACGNVYRFKPKH